MAQRFPKQVRQTAEALAAEDLNSRQIAARIRNGTAGLREKYEVSDRTVRDWVAAYVAEHGPLPPPEEADPTADSFTRLRHRIAARVQKEVAAYERKAPGKLTASDLKQINALWNALHNFERKALLQEAGQRRGKRKGEGSAGAAQQERELTPLEQWARDADEPTDSDGTPGDGAGPGPTADDPLSTTPIPSTTEDGERAAGGTDDAAGADGDQGASEEERGRGRSRSDAHAADSLAAGVQQPGQPAPPVVSPV